MRTEAMGMTGRWWRFSDYEIRGECIVPAQGATLEQYDPWEAFSTADQRHRGHRKVTPYVELIGAFGWLTGTVPQAATLSDASRRHLLDWCRRYGLPGRLLHISRRITVAPRRERLQIGTGPMLVQPIYHLTDLGWRTELEWDETKFRDPEIVTEDRGKRAKLPFSDTCERFFPSVPADQRESYSYPAPMSEQFWRLYGEDVADVAKTAGDLNMAISYLRQLDQEPTSQDARQLASVGAELLSSLTATVHPTLRRKSQGRRPETWCLSWSATSLVGVLATMAMLDMSQSLRPVYCSACGRLFVTQAWQGRYCSDTCAYRVRKSRQRARKKPRPAHKRG